MLGLTSRYRNGESRGAAEHGEVSPIWPEQRIPSGFKKCRAFSPLNRDHGLSEADGDSLSSRSAGATDCYHCRSAASGSPALPGRPSPDALLDAAEAGRLRRSAAAFLIRGHYIGITTQRRTTPDRQGS